MLLEDVHTRLITAHNDFKACQTRCLWGWGCKHWQMLPVAQQVFNSFLWNLKDYRYHKKYINNPNKDTWNEYVYKMNSIQHMMPTQNICTKSLLIGVSLHLDQPNKVTKLLTKTLIKNDQSTLSPDEIRHFIHLTLILTWHCEPNVPCLIQNLWLQNNYENITLKK